MAEGKVTLKFSFKGAIESIVFYGNIACNALVASLQRKFGAGIDPSYLIIDGEEVLLNDDAIRLVLVKNQSKIYGIPELRAPPAPAAAAAPAAAQDNYAKENNELLKSLVAKLEKPLDLSMSKITTGQWDEIAADLGIDAAGLQTFTDATTTDAPAGFTWNQRIQESHQAEEYLSWMQTALKDCASVVVVKGSEVDLSLPQLAAMQRCLHGKSDLVILFHAVHQTPEARSGIVFVVELKKTTTHAAQLKAQLLAASYHSKQRPVGVLTDLRDDWYFYWFEQKNNKPTLCAAKAARARALGWIRLRCAELPAKEAASMSTRSRSPRKGTARAASPRAARPSAFPFSAAARLSLSLAPPAWAELPAYEAGLLGETEAADLRFSLLMYSLLHAPGLEVRGPFASTPGGAKTPQGSEPPELAYHKDLSSWMQSPTSEDVFQAALAEYEIPYGELEVSTVLGEGAFGRVVRVKYAGSDFAAKMLKVHADDLDDEEKELFKAEIMMLFKLRHPNVVQFVNLSRDPTGGLVLISEFMGGGSLNLWLYKKKHQFPAAVMRRLSYQISAGLAFLHSRSIMHRDLKSENILLDQEGLNAKLADLGLAKPRSSTTMKSIAGTIMYMAPEVLTGQGYGMPADVYSFSLVIFELYASKRPFPMLDFPQMIAKVGTANERPAIPPSMPTDVASLLQCCWHRDPAQRPPMVTVAQQLQQASSGALPADVLPAPPATPSPSPSTPSRRPSSPLVAVSRPAAARPKAAPPTPPTATAAPASASSPSSAPSPLPPEALDVNSPLLKQAAQYLEALIGYEAAAEDAPTYRDAIQRVLEIVLSSLQRALPNMAFEQQDEIFAAWIPPHYVAMFTAQRKAKELARTMGGGTPKKPPSDLITRISSLSPHQSAGQLFTLQRFQNEGRYKHKCYQAILRILIEKAEEKVEEAGGHLTRNELVKALADETLALYVKQLSADYIAHVLQIPREDASKWKEGKVLRLQVGPTPSSPSPNFPLGVLPSTAPSVVSSPPVPAAPPPPDPRSVISNFEALVKAELEPDYGVDEDDFGTNISLMRKAEASSTDARTRAALQVVNSGTCERLKYFQTAEEDAPYWGVDLGRSWPLHCIRILVEAHGGLWLNVLLSNDKKTWVTAYENCGRPLPLMGQPFVVGLREASAQFVRVQLARKGSLTLYQVEVYTRAQVPASELPPKQFAPVESAYGVGRHHYPGTRTTKADVQSLQDAHIANLRALFPGQDAAQADLSMAAYIRTNSTKDDAQVQARQKERKDNFQTVASEEARMREWHKARGVPYEKASYVHPSPGSWPPPGMDLLAPHEYYTRQYGYGGALSSVKRLSEAQNAELHKVIQEHCRSYRRKAGYGEDAELALLPFYEAAYRRFPAHTAHSAMLQQIIADLSEKETSNIEHFALALQPVFPQYTLTELDQLASDLTAIADNNSLASRPRRPPPKTSPTPPTSPPLVTVPSISSIPSTGSTSSSPSSVKIPSVGSLEAPDRCSFRFQVLSANVGREGAGGVAAVGLILGSVLKNEKRLPVEGVWEIQVECNGSSFTAHSNLTRENPRWTEVFSWTSLPSSAVMTFTLKCSATLAARGTFKISDAFKTIKSAANYDALVPLQAEKKMAMGSAPALQIRFSPLPSDATPSIASIKSKRLPPTPPRPSTPTTVAAAAPAVVDDDSEVMEAK